MVQFNGRSMGDEFIFAEAIVGTPNYTPVAGTADLITKKNGVLRLADYKTKVVKITYDDGTPTVERSWRFFTRSGKFGDSSKLKAAVQTHQYRTMFDDNGVIIDEVGVYPLSVELKAHFTGTFDTLGNKIYTYQIDHVHPATEAEGYKEKPEDIDTDGFTTLHLTAEVRDRLISKFPVNPKTQVTTIEQRINRAVYNLYASL